MVAPYKIHLSFSYSEFVIVLCVIHFANSDKLHSMRVGYDASNISDKINRGL